MNNLLNYQNGSLILRPSEEMGSNSSGSSSTSSAEGCRLAIPTELPSLGGVIGDIDGSDLFPQTLDIVQTVGQLSTEFKPGDIVYNRDTVLSDGNTPIDLTVLCIQKQYEEALDPGERRWPAVYNSRAEVNAAGGTVDPGDDGGRLYIPRLTVQVLVKAPEGLDYPMPYSYNDEEYGMATWTLRKTAYDQAGKHIATLAINYRDGVHHWKWKLKTIRKDRHDSNPYWVPKISNVGKHSEEFVEFIKSIVA